LYVLLIGMFIANWYVRVELLQHYKSSASAPIKSVFGFILTIKHISDFVLNLMDTQQASDGYTACLEKDQYTFG
jgi:hypothetical protein